MMSIFAFGHPYHIAAVRVLDILVIATVITHLRVLRSHLELQPAHLLQLRFVRSQLDLLPRAKTRGHRLGRLEMVPAESDLVRLRARLRSSRARRIQRLPG